MKLRTIGMALLVVSMLAATSGLAAANHDGADQCDQLNNALDAIEEHADENGEENNEVDRAKDECEGDHHQDQANDGSDNADQASDGSGSPDQASDGSDDADQGDESSSEQSVPVAFGLVA